MNDSPITTVVPLARREVVSLSMNRGDSIVCLSGSLWCTCGSLAGDLVLGRGQSLTPERRDVVYVQGLQAASFRLVRHARAWHLRLLNESPAVARHIPAA